jgi:hypothetical protein
VKTKKKSIRKESSDYCVFERMWGRGICEKSLVGFD